MGQCVDAPLFLQLSEYFLQAEYLRRVLASHGQGLPEKGGVIHAVKKRDVPRDDRLQEGIVDVIAPSREIPDEGDGAGVPPPEEVLVQCPVERLLAFRKAPMGARDELEPPREAFAHPPLDQERGRTQKNGAQAPFIPDILIMKKLDHFAPTRDFLDFINNQEGLPALEGPGLPPIFHEEFRPRRRDFIRRDIKVGGFPGLQELLNEGCFPDLARPDHDLQDMGLERQMSFQLAGNVFSLVVQGGVPILTICSGA